MFEAYRMRMTKPTKNAIVSAAMIGMLLPTSLFATDDLLTTSSGAPSVPRRIDVALGKQSILRGNLVDNAGNPATNVNVFIARDGQIVAVGQSNDQGAFAVANMSGGNYQISAGDRAIDVRCWAGDTAPPSALARTLIQVNDVTRGQIHPGTCMLANPWRIAGIAAAAVLIPVGIKSIRDNRDDDDDGNNGAGNTIDAS